MMLENFQFVKIFLGVILDHLQAEFALSRKPNHGTSFLYKNMDRSLRISYKGSLNDSSFEENCLEPGKILVRPDLPMEEPR